MHKLVVSGVSFYLICMVFVVIQNLCIQVSCYFVECQVQDLRSDLHLLWVSYSSSYVEPQEAQARVCQRRTKTCYF